MDLTKHPTRRRAPEEGTQRDGLLQPYEGEGGPHRSNAKAALSSEAKRRSSEAGGSEEHHRLTGILTARTGKRFQSSIGLHPVDGDLTKSSR